MILSYVVAPDDLTVVATPSDAIILGENVNLTCVHSGGPNNSFAWFKDSLLIQSAIEDSLFLPELNSTHGGNYSCVVSNIAGVSSANRVVYVHPYITIQPVPLTTVENGSVANLTCEADGFPMPAVVWIKYQSFENRTLFDVVENGTELFFETVLFGVEGYYACRASSVRLDGGFLTDAVSEISILSGEFAFISHVIVITPLSKVVFYSCSIPCINCEHSRA